MKKQNAKKQNAKKQKQEKQPAPVMGAVTELEVLSLWSKEEPTEPGRYLVAFVNLQNDVGIVKKGENITAVQLQTDGVFRRIQQANGTFPRVDLRQPHIKVVGWMPFPEFPKE